MPGPPKGIPRSPGSGRKPGTPNHVTTDTRRMILEALSAEGGIEYLRKQARENPNGFLSLVKAVLPRDTNISLTGTTWEELLAATINRPNPPPAAT